MASHINSVVLLYKELKTELTKKQINYNKCGSLLDQLKVKINNLKDLYKKNNIT